MAASIYATPPPDLSSEDTALSDVSNTSTTATATAATTTTTTATIASNATAALRQLPSTTTTTNTISQATLTTSLSTPTTATLTINSSNDKNSNNSKLQQKFTASDALKDPKSQCTITFSQCSSNQHNFVGSPINATHDDHGTQDSVTNKDNKNDYDDENTTTATAMAAMQLQLLEAINDTAKKRRKQFNPSRMDEEGLETSEPVNPVVDYEDKLSKMLLPKSMEQLKETFEFLQRHHQQQRHIENISKNQEMNASIMEDHQQHRQAYNPYHTFCKECGENFENEFKLSLHMLQEHNDNNDSFTQTQSVASDITPLDILASVKVKLERPECESPSTNQNSVQAGNPNELTHRNNTTSVTLTNGKEQQQQQEQQQRPQWMGVGNMPPMGFPFPPEAAAAAALQAGGYLPLLAVPSFAGVDGLNRPPLRIFNPEAFCELCNKEFCNKYFLKTHKANKHGIYDPSGDGLNSSQQQQQNNMNAMNQMFQLQMQQHQHLQQQQHIHLELAQQQQKLLTEQQQQQQRKDSESTSSPNTNIPTSTNATATITSGITKATQNSGNSQQSTTQVTPPAPQPVFCDICSKRFTNVFAMRRHRAKVHEQNSNNSSQRNSPSESSNSTMEVNPTTSQTSDTQAVKQFQMPEGFRQDFVLEQEEVSFTPQPRKLSPQSQQQAREANFAHDKLKRLGVLNPEAFCEICCKEYCNKYFLRTHKWKRHGIFVPPEDAENFQKLTTWPFMNVPGMPVNLMMAQRIMTQTETITEDLNQQSSKRIKLEQPDEDELIKVFNNDENQENRSENNQVPSVPSTPEPHKLANENQSTETAMGLQNLQKLQTMIQQLNDLNGKRPIACHLCGREMENQYTLQIHIMTDHGGGMEGNISSLNFSSQILMQQQTLLKQSPNSSPSSLMPLMGVAGSGELRCTPCERDFNSLAEFQKHIAEAHLLTNTSGSPLREGFVTPERPINPPLGQGTRPPYTITPTSSYCEICNKELCNKYFMKTHMQRMHGIEIENGAQIGGVVCNICNKELCSKYFLRVHKHNTHGIIEDGAPLPQPRQNGLNLESALQQQIMESDSLNRNLNMSPFSSGGSEGKSEAYTPSSYTEVCPICSRRFRNTKWLRSHLLSDHGSNGLEKVRELDQQYSGSLSKPSSPTLKIPNGSNSAGSVPVTPTAVPSPAQLAQALQNLNAQHLLKNNMTTTFNSDQNLQSSQLKEYQCSICPFTTPYYAFLFIHERTHTILNKNEPEQEQEQEQEHETQAQNESLQNNKPEEGCLQQEKKPLKRKLTIDSKVSPEVIALDQDEHEAENDDDKLVANEHEPTNLSMRTPSPTDNTSTTNHENLSKANSPKDNICSEIKHGSHSLSLSPKGSRTTACSPLFNNHQQQLLHEVAQQTGKIASFAVPHNENESPQMQAFVIEAVSQSDEMDITNRFVPAIVYLPVRERITGTTMKLSFNLTPV